MTLSILIGPVGAGKSTFAIELCAEQQAVHLDLDAWMARLYGDDERPPTGRIEWYLERRDRCVEQIWHVAQRMLDVGCSVVLEIGLIRRAERDAFYARLDGAGYHPRIYVVDAPKESRWARVQRRNRDKGRTFSMEVPEAFFELASSMWEPPDEAEHEARKPVVVLPAPAGGDVSQA